MLPVYYTPQGMTAAEVKLAKSAWDMIADDLSPVYLEKLCSTTFSKSYSTCKDWYVSFTVNVTLGNFLLILFCIYL